MAENNGYVYNLVHVFYRLVYLLGFLCFQGAEESELPVPSNAGPDSAERASFPGDTVSPSSNVQLPSATVASSALTADYTSTLASLRMVQLINSLLVMSSLSLSLSLSLCTCVQNHVNTGSFSVFMDPLYLEFYFLFLILFK